MSRDRFPDRPPFIALTEKAARALRADMIQRAHEAGFTEMQLAHSAVFATLPREGARAADMALRAGITRQSMGEVIRDMVGLGMVEMIADPTDGRAKIVRWTDYGQEVAAQGHRRLLEVETMLIEEFGEPDYDVARRVLGRVRELLEGEGPAAPRAD